MGQSAGKSTENPSITVTVTVTVTYTVTLPNQIKIFVHLAMHECVFCSEFESNVRLKPD